MRIIIITIALSFFSLAAQAEKPDKIYYELVDAAGFNADMARPFVDEYVEMLDSVLKEKNIEMVITESKEVNMLKMAKNFFTSAKLLDFMAEAYASAYTSNEAKELTVFFRTNTGKAFVKNNPVLLEWIEKNRDEIYSDFGEEMSELYFSDLR